MSKEREYHYVTLGHYVDDNDPSKHQVGVCVRIDGEVHPDHYFNEDQMLGLYEMLKEKYGENNE
jgi:hypothetical protein